ncbi:uncharacterized protein LOC117215221 [Bombus bifarius]|uniref:Uncharacterized protein LOC117215221 n=1 Tax=Bombus bifarius TaxID=103933 RepID=A0A6P8MUI1_9HYME|nr:uncharacterized protein LOC117215221 [Bombus bifarius]
MNFMTDKLANSLGIKQRRCAIQIGAPDNLSTTAKRYTTATTTSTDGKYKKTLRFLVIPAISTFIPSEPLDPSSLGLPRNIQLADPQFHCPAPIDVLLSTGSTFASLCIGQVNLAQPGEPELRLQKTRFGWVIGGSPTSQTAINTFHATTTALQEDLARFWEIDEGPATTHLSESERLWSSKAAAMSRLASLHRRFQRDKQYETAYTAVIQEYLDLGHMTKINTDHATDHGYYLPHHGVIKESSDTTKLRVVFDGSASSTTGVSLNDALHTGPKLREDLRNILLRFRSFQYVLTGDIEKMYRQFILRPEDRPYQKILWRADSGEIETYRLNTVTFGLSAAPYLAIRCLKQLAEDEGPRFPRAAQILRRDFYVDDALTGADTKDEALSVRNDLTKLLKLASLNIRKWASNDRDLLRGLSEEGTNQKLHLGESSTLKTLDVFWDSADDSILYSVKTISGTSRVTKRSISSVIAQIYDPLGLLAPVIVRVKMILQQVWTLKVDWDESLPTDVHTEWIKYHTQLPLLNAALTTKISRIVYWTDSTIVLHWIRSSPHTLKTFVTNRVAEIQTKTNISDWRHEPTDDNPADLISRGQTPKEFLCPSIWKNGPRWLLQSENYWPVWSPAPVEDLPEQRKTICLKTNINDNTLLHRYSSWPRLIRIVAWSLRWRHRQHRSAHLTTDELTAAHNRLIKIIQSNHFAPEIRTLQKNRSEDVGGKLQPLNPFLDEDGILRVGGRLTNSAIPFSQKHPIILSKSPVTELIIEQEHRNNHHTGTQATLYAVRLRYWPIDGRSQVWRTLRRCVRCCTANPPPVEYLMGDLPEARITESRPFTNVGIDYCGPFYIKERRDRNRRKIKTYAAIFVCLATKAVHIELVSDLTTDAFLAALRRFISRRGYCATILTDNGTNFVGANRELQQVLACKNPALSSSPSAQGGRLSSFEQDSDKELETFKTMSKNKACTDSDEQSIEMINQLREEIAQMQRRMDLSIQQAKEEGQLLDKEIELLRKTIAEIKLGRQETIKEATSWSYQGSLVSNKLNKSLEKKDVTVENEEMVLKEFSKEFQSNVDNSYEKKVSIDTASQDYIFIKTDLMFDVNSSTEY